MSRRKYVIGGKCNNGHLLINETAYARSSGNIICRVCKAKTDDIYRRKNQNKIQNNQLRWSRNNPERKWKTARKNHLKRMYGITPEQYDAMWQLQKGKCAICGKEPETNIGGERPHWLSLYVDHCHVTKKVRGLLCWNHNVALGHFRDNVTLMKTAINYLESGGFPNIDSVLANVSVQDPSNLKALSSI